MYELKVKTHFDAAHRIRDYIGECANEHGHRWNVEIVITSEVLDSMNMVVDFAKVKGIVKEFDHCNLNKKYNEGNATAEWAARKLYGLLGSGIKANVESVTVWESPDCSVTWRPDGRRS